MLGLKWQCVRVKLFTHQALVCLSQTAKESEVDCLQIPSAFSEEILFGIADGVLDVVERTIFFSEWRHHDVLVIQLTLHSICQHNFFILKQSLMFRIKVSHLHALTTISLPDALPTLGSHSVYIYGGWNICWRSIFGLLFLGDALIQNICG